MKLLKTKKLYLRLLLCPVFFAAGYFGTRHVSTMLDQKLEQGCTMALKMVVRPLFPMCFIENNRLVVTIINGQKFDIKTGVPVR